MSSQGSQTGQHTRCLRCGRRLTAQASLSRGYGRTCRARITAAGEAADLSEFHPWQVEKAREAIEEKSIVPLSRPGLYAAVSTDGTLTYLVDAIEGSCSCKAAATGRRCYHRAGALILDASAITRRAA